VRILVTGFGAFLDHRRNPSAALARAMHGRARGRLVTLEPLPVVYGEAAALALGEARRVGATGVVALGLAADAPAIRVEHVGRNRSGPEARDTRGRTGGRAVVPGAPLRRPVTLDPEPIRRALHAAGIAVDRSDDAGDYVCNDLLYRLLQAGVPALFVHVPSDVDAAQVAGPLTRGILRAAARGPRRMPDLSLFGARVAASP
jgi:pyroglutamyl-peptidase